MRWSQRWVRRLRPRTTEGYVGLSGLDLAKRILTKMMLEGEPSDWQELIMSAGG